jgi:hypothetical protein
MGHTIICTTIDQPLFGSGVTLIYSEIWHSATQTMIDWLQNPEWITSQYINYYFCHHTWIFCNNNEGKINNLFNHRPEREKAVFDEASQISNNFSIAPWWLLFGRFLWDDKDVTTGPQISNYAPKQILIYASLLIIFSLFISFSMPS